ncbi:MAG TPA: DUF3100 domain-containing protein [Candidatus Salinicoccus stercoripullorum]|uniref:DUF3100 domain-containing protein n=1 Tax=Candidatus Salinicoccus stercoripullorum TaxID=2838756 RepID=A0A9D1U0A5_9STAP|nr:DUF3100 domain-containing protein [Candidatus Salinicoccus stercoripullorum]
MSNEPKSLWRDWRLHAVVLGIVILTELIGTYEIAIGAGVILLLPMLYAVVIGLGTFFTPLISKAQSKKAETLVFMSVTLLIAKFGVEAGPALPELIRAGPALILQEIGNPATVLVALPLAIFLGLKRETIGMTHSIGREANLALISEKFGISSPEGRGVVAMYIFGTIFGAIFMGLASGLLASLLPISPLSFAMATGIGSGSMTAASLGPLVSMFPEQSDIITAYSGASNLLTSVTGLYMSLFIALPLAEKYYSFVMRIKSKGKGADMIEREAD